MNAQNAPGKDGTYPPAPSVEDDASPASSTRDFDDDYHEFDEAYVQAYVAYKRLREGLSQDGGEEAEEDVEEVDEGEDKESSDILIEYISDDESPTASSHPSAQVQIPNCTCTSVYHERVLPLYQHRSTQPRHHRVLHSAPAQTRLIHEMPHIHQAAVSPLHTSSAPHRMQQRHQNRHVNHPRHPLPRCICGMDDRAARPEDFQDAHVLRRVYHQPRGGARLSGVLPCWCGVSDGYFQRKYGSGAERRDSANGREPEEAEVLEKFAEVFNAIRKIDADISALRKVLEGLMLERFGGHTEF